MFFSLLIEMLKLLPYSELLIYHTREGAVEDAELEG